MATNNKGFRQGRYHPRNPDKYKGDITNIVYRSSWELKVCQFLDFNPNVRAWCSEPFSIPYIKPTTGRIHKYYVDFYVKYIDRNGNEQIEILEVKPNKQTTPSNARNRKTALHENITYAINKAKWEAASQFAERHGIKFRIVTEGDIFR